jgi:hypothetical protein
LCINTFACLKINQYSTGLFVSYSQKNPIVQNYFRPSLSPGPSGGSQTRTLNLRMMWQVFYNCATTHSITTLSIKGLFATFSIMTLSMTMRCHYVECRILFTFMLNVVMVNVVMLSVIAPSTTVPPPLGKSVKSVNKDD